MGPFQGKATTQIDLIEGRPVTKSEREKWDADPWAETPMGSMGVKYVYIYICMYSVVKEPGSIS